MGRLNKPEIEGYRYRSPKQTNARDLTPHPLEETIPAQEADIGRIRRGLNADAAREYNRRLQQEAGGRAALRTGARAGLAGLAYEGGKAAGRALDEKYPELGKKIVDKTVGPVIDKMVEKSRDKVELSKDAKRRIKEENDESVNTRGDFDYEPTARMMGMKKGGAVKMAKGGSVSSASSRGDGCAQRGKTKGRML
jgi:hypothetical protein